MTSKRIRNNAAASSAAPPPPIPPTPRNYCDDQGIRERWPVLIYRLQSHRGWEVYSDDQASERRTPPPARSLSNNGGGGHGGGTAAAEAEELTATPREGCIEVRKMRLRIRLFEQHVPWDDRADRTSSSSARAGAVADEDDRDARGDADMPGLDGWNDNALVVRRRNTLLVTTRRGMGAVVFRFASTRDCVDFCDRLVYLNRRVLLAPPPRRKYHVCEIDDEDADASTMRSPRGRGRGQGSGSGIIVADERRREHRIDESNSAKRRKLAALGDIREDSRRRESIVNYIVQLAHSEDFRGFVDEIERGLEYASDTAAIHAALGL
jgi:hypothetical protein